MLEALKEVVFFNENRFSKRQTFSGRNPAKFSSAGPEPEPENEAGYPAGTGLCRISGRFLVSTQNCRPGLSDNHVVKVQYVNHRSRKIL